MAGKNERLSAGVIVVRFVGGEPRFLLLRAYRYWDFPKGEVGAGETPLAAAVRETGEETGIADLAFRWGEDGYETEAYAGGKRARYFLAEAHTAAVRPGVNPQLGRPEHHEYRWCAPAEARALLGRRVRAALAWALAKLSA